MTCECASNPDPSPVLPLGAAVRDACHQNAVDCWSIRKQYATIKSNVPTQGIPADFGSFSLCGHGEMFSHSRGINGAFSCSKMKIFEPGQPSCLLPEHRVHYKMLKSFVSKLQSLVI
jgi:hypothetical protein